MMSSEFMPLSLETRYTASPYATGESSSTMTKEELEALGYTVSDPSTDLGLDFTDFLQLMVAQLQNQTMDNAADTSDMMNQLVQMSVVQMMSSVKTSLDNLTDASTLTYAASLVGKTVTVGVYDEEGNVQEVVGTVTGTGTYQGTPVIFVNDEMYPLSNIMAVGTLPDVPDEGDTGSDGDGGQTGETGGEDQNGGASTQAL